MVNLIVNHIVTELKLSLPFVDKITGIVKTASINTGGTVKTFPIALNDDITACNPNQLLDFTPNNKYTSVIYFEDRGTRVDRMENQSIYFTSSFTLICWFDFRKIAGCMSNTSYIAGNIIKYLPEIVGNLSPLNSVIVSVVGEQANDGNVFSKYSYLEEVNQYITYPYGYVALDLQAEFRVRKECIEDIEICTALC